MQGEVRFRACWPWGAGTPSEGGLVGHRGRGGLSRDLGEWSSALSATSGARPTRKGRPGLQPG